MTALAFVHSWMLAVTALVVALAAFVAARAERRRRAALAAFADPALLAGGSALPEASRRGRRWRLECAALALAGIALARPQWGERPLSLSQTGRDVLVLLDLSRSMNVADVPPSRLGAAQRAVEQLATALPGDRFGLVVFGGSAFLQLPLVSDHAAFSLFLQAARTRDLGDPATDLSNALRTARATFEHDGARSAQVVLLVSDGEATAGELDGPLADLRRAGTPVFALGVGTPDGGPVPADSGSESGQWHTDWLGRVTVSHLEEESLRRVAQETGGAYVRWTPDGGPGDLAAKIGAIEGRPQASVQGTQAADRFQWPLGAAVLLLLAASLLPTTRPESRRGTTESRRRALSPLAAAATAVVVLLLGCDPAHTAAREGERHYAKERWREAQEAFVRALDASGDPQYEYDAGNALYRMKRYDEAVKRFGAALGGPPALRTAALYNLGAAYVRAAEEQEDEEQRQSLRRAVDAYEQVLRANPADSAAKWNLEVALHRLGDDQPDKGSKGRAGRADYGRGNMDTPGYEGNEQEAVGAMAGGGYGSAPGESAKELSEAEARQLLDAVQREQLKTHEGRPSPKPVRGERDW